MHQILTVSLRQKAVFIPDSVITGEQKALTETTSVLVSNLASLGYGVSEQLLRALNNTTPAFKASLLEQFRYVMGVRKNWTPLVKGWDNPTGESIVDHVITLFANIFKTAGTQLPCGHTIPDKTFPLHRYNGCPFCGTPFVFGDIERYKQGSNQKVLELWTMQDAAAFLEDLLTSQTALDATQTDSLKMLLAVLPVPGVQIKMKETLMTVIDILVNLKQAEKAQVLFTSPADIMRYLWYKHTGFLQVIEPKTIVKRHNRNNRHHGAQSRVFTKASLKLKYNRAQCLVVAAWMNELPMENSRICEIMHTKRGMWVRFIRALRLAEYSKRKGFEKLKAVLDTFYNEDYETWQGQVDRYRLRYDAAKTFALLKQRPGLFARSLFANMLWFGCEDTIAAFGEIIDQVPARLVFTLNMYADYYFDISGNRTVKPLGGINKNIPRNHLLTLYSKDQLESMKSAVAGLCLLSVEKRFAAIESSNKTIYIDPNLFRIPVAIGDRSETIQDLPGAIMGTRFKVEGTQVRLFMQWGTGLPAQHMDMDLSCHIAFKNRSTQICSFSYLTTTGCKHSGDIRSIPHKTGTAEYIELDLEVLKKWDAQYVTFTCNAYSHGGITPNLVIGWMNSKNRMAISENTGVAYDPSCVQHQVRVVNSLTKGMVFGVLDVQQQEIVWLEIPFEGQLVQDLNIQNVATLLKKLESKLSIGELLTLKAEAQALTMVETVEADEVYTMEWARNTAAVTKLLID